MGGGPRIGLRPYQILVCVDSPQCQLPLCPRSLFLAKYISYLLCSLNQLHIRKTRRHSSEQPFQDSGVIFLYCRITLVTRYLKRRPGSGFGAVRAANMAASWQAKTMNSEAQRLASQPLGRHRFSISILAGKYKSKLNVFSLGLGQVG